MDSFGRRRDALVLVSTSDPIITLHPILEAVGVGEPIRASLHPTANFRDGNVNLYTPPSDAPFRHVAPAYAGL
ncbi:MAG UNVERIFIED_CONTAM: hypothetical protein LVT10_14105 [Anaerolineae bacterium]